MGNWGDMGDRIDEGDMADWGDRVSMADMGKRSDMVKGVTWATGRVFHKNTFFSKKK